MIPSLGKAEPLESGFRRIAVECIDMALSGLGGDKGRDAAIHTVRKQSKQLRALLRLFRAQLGNLSRDECRALRDLSRSLSTARDSQVVQNVHAHLVGLFGEIVDSRVAEGVRQELIAEFASRDSTISMKSNEDEGLRRFLLATRERAESWTIEDADIDSLASALVRTYRRARHTALLASETGHIADFHELRKRAKDYWYQLEFAADCWPEFSAARNGSAHKLTELLGDAHDFEIYSEALSGAPAHWNHRAASLFSAIAVQRMTKLHEEACALADRVFGDKPKQLATDLEGTAPLRQASGQSR